MNTTEPKSFIQGETVQFNMTFADYKPADGCSLTYYLRGLAGGIDVAGSADGAGWIFTLSSDQTAVLATGDYAYQAFAVKDSDKFLVSEGKMTVRAGLSTIAKFAPYDNRSQAERDLEAVRAMIAGKATADVQSYAIGNRQLSKIPIPDLIALETRLAERVRRERQAARLKKGGAFFKTIHVRMTDD